MTEAFYITGGTLPLDASSYIVRQADAELLDGLRKGEFCYVLNTRQMGKSSLMVRTARQLAQEGFHVLVLDLTAVGQNLSVDQWYYGLLNCVTARTTPAQEEALLAYWRAHRELGPMQRFVEALHHVLLIPEATQGEVNSPGLQSFRVPPSTQSPLVIFVDEIDAVRSLPFSADEFFGGIRECYNRRAHDPVFKHLTFCLLGVATPSDLIQDTRLSPFNIGRRIELHDFKAEEAETLACGLLPEKRLNPRTSRLLSRVLYWTNGHPYMTQRLCREVAQHLLQTTDTPETANHKEEHIDEALVDSLCERLFLSKAAQENDDNLSFARNRLLKSGVDLPALLDLYAHVWRGQPIRDDETDLFCGILRLSGVVAVEDGLLRLRNRVYAQVFDQGWVRHNMPGAELRRQKQAYTRGMVRAAAVGGLVSLALAVLAGWAIHAEGLAKRSADQAKRAEQNLLGTQRTEREQQRHLEEANNRILEQERRAKNSEQAALRSAQKEIQSAQQARDAQKSADTSADIARQQQQRADSVAQDNMRLANERQQDLQETQKAKAQVDQRLYTLNMSLIKQEWQNGNVQQAEQLLNETASSHYHHFEWGFWKRLLSIERQNVQNRSAGEITSLAFFPDGKRAVMADNRGRGYVWDFRSRRVLYEVARPMPLWAITCSPDGQHIAAGGESGSIFLWDADTGQHLRALEGGTEWVTTIAYSPDNSLLASAGAQGDIVRVWDAATGKVAYLSSKYPSLTRSVAFSEDGKILWVGLWDGKAFAWNLHTGTQKQLVTRHNGPINAFAFAPNARYFVTASNDYTARIWDANTGALIHMLAGHTNRVTAVAISSDNRWIVTGSSDNLCILWDAATGLEKRRFIGHYKDLTSVAFSPDGNFILTGSADGATRLWDLQAEHRFLALPAQSSLASLAFSPDGRYLMTGAGSNRARAWDVTTGQLLFTLAGPETFLLKDHGPAENFVSAIAFSRDGGAIATGNNDGTASVWDARTHRKLCTLECHSRSVNCLAFSLDGKRLVAGLHEGDCLVWDWQSGRRLLTLKGNQASVRSLAFSPDGKTLATGTQDGKAIFWNAQTGQQIRPALAHHGFVSGVAFSPDGRELATSCSDHTASVWDVATGHEKRRLLGHRDWVMSIAYSRDGRRLITGSMDRTARLWDVDSGIELLSLFDYDNAVMAVAFAPDMKHIATANHGGRALIWLSGAAGLPP